MLNSRLVYAKPSGSKIYTLIEMVIKFYSAGTTVPSTKLCNKRKPILKELI